MMKHFSVVILLFVTSFYCKAQKNITYTNQQWLQYYNQLKFSTELTLYTDLSVRRMNNFNDWSQITFRTGAGYQLTQNLQGVTGIACFGFYTKNKRSKIEFRPYQEINSTQSFGKISVQHRLRVEARYFRKITDGVITSASDFNFRFRYRLYCSVPVLKMSESITDRKLLLNLGDELFINAGKEITYNMLDNNRLLVGLTFQYNNNLSFTFGYINQFGQRSSQAAYENSDIFTFGIIQKIKLSKE